MGSSIANVDEKIESKVVPFEESTDFANYFCTYGFLYHQKSMLTDMARMNAYRDSIFLNAEKCFKDKVVLDVGTGSGILSLWAAQAGAKKVYAVEATSMAKHARKIVEANNQSHVITVIQGKIEEIELPEKVDIIISEWMGYFLLRESMLDSVLFARDTFLKEGGALYPSHCTMYVGAVKADDTNDQRSMECDNGMEAWTDFVESTKSKFGVDMSCLNGAFRDEQELYSLYTSAFVTMNANQIIGEPAPIHTIDLMTCQLEDIKTVKSNFEIQMTETTRFGGLCGWFDVDFHGSKENPVESSVTLSTSPYCEPTHWGQQLFTLHPAKQVVEKDLISGTIFVTRRADNQRLMNVKFENEIVRHGATRRESPTTTIFQVE